MDVKLISLLPLEHWKKKQGTKGAGKLLPAVFPVFEFHHLISLAYVRITLLVCLPFSLSC